jgi:hypothetical protein
LPHGPASGTAIAAYRVSYRVRPRAFGPAAEREQMNNENIRLDPELESGSPRSSVNGEAIKDISRSFLRVVRSELHLATTEFKHAFRNVSGNSKVLLISAVIAALGVLPILSFLVIGLGRILNDNYWLSSLIVGLLMVGGGCVVAYGCIKRMRINDLSLPLTRRSLADEQRMLSGKVRSISDTTRSRIRETASLDTYRDTDADRRIS